MYIQAVPNRTSPPAILLRESYREAGKVRKRTRCNLSDWPAAHIEGLRGVLKGGTVIPAEREAFTVSAACRTATSTALILGLLAPHPTIALAGVVRNLVLVPGGNIIGAAIFIVGGYLSAARTDTGAEARHDTGPFACARHGAGGTVRSPCGRGSRREVLLVVLRLCREAGLVRLGLVALDGTKVRANAALDANRTASSLDEQVAEMLAEAEAADTQEDRQFGVQRGDELPAPLARRADRLARLQQWQAKLQRQAVDAASRQQEKIDARAAAERASGKRQRGRKPKPADPAVYPDTVANVTDPDSGIMKTRHGWLQGYNALPGRSPVQHARTRTLPRPVALRRSRTQSVQATPGFYPPFGKGQSTGHKRAAESRLSGFLPPSALFSSVRHPTPVISQQALWGSLTTSR